MLLVIEVFSVVLQRTFCEKTLLRGKESKSLNAAVWGCYFIVFNFVTYAATEYFHIAWLNLLIVVLAFFLTIKILYSNPARTLLAVTSFMYLSGMCAELLVYYAKELLSSADETELELLCIVVSKLVWFLIVKLVSALVIMGRKTELSGRDWLEVFLVPTGSIWIMLAIYMTGTLENYVFGFIATAMILMINLFTYYLYDKAKETMENRMRQEALAKQCAYYIRQDRESRDWLEALRQFRHNMNQHFILEKTYLENRDYTALEKYCNKNLNFLDVKAGVSNTGNLYIDSIVNYKADVADREGISLLADIKVPGDAEMNAEDITICLGNILDNAIEAVKKRKDDREIHLCVSADQDNLFIHIVNAYSDGMIRKEGGRYLSSKGEGRGHGLGLLIVRQIVEKYEGEMTIQDKNGKFDVIIVMFGFLK